MKISNWLESAPAGARARNMTVRASNACPAKLLSQAEPVGFLFRLKACPKACSGLRLELWDAALRGCKCGAVPVQYFYPKVNCRVLEDPKSKPQLQLSVFRQVSFARQQKGESTGFSCSSQAVNGLPLFIFGRTTRFPSELRLLAPMPVLTRGSFKMISFGHQNPGKL